MREFAADPEAGMHPQTVIEHFGTWNAAKRAAGLTPRRFISRDELLEQLRQLGEELGRTPTARDLDANRRRVASKSLIWHTFGSLSAALREAGFDVPVGDEKLERAVDQGAVLARELGRLPRMADWKEARRDGPSLMSEWQVYRLVDIDAGPWAAFQYLVRERLREEGVTRAARRLALAPGDATRRASELREARGALVRRAHGRQRPGRRGSERSARKRASVAIRPRSRWSSRPSETSCLRSVSRSAPSTTSSADFVEAKKTSRRARPIQSGRATPRARCRRPCDALVDPGGRHRAAQLLERRVIRPRQLHEREDRLGVDGHARARRARSPCRARISSSLTMIPLWIPTTEPCRIGWLLASSVGWPLV